MKLQRNLQVLSSLKQLCLMIVREDRFRLQMACLTPDTSVAEGIIQDCREYAEEYTLRTQDVFEHGTWTALHMATWGNFSFPAWREHMRLWIRSK